MVAIVRKSLSRLLASCYADQTRQAGTNSRTAAGMGTKAGGRPVDFVAVNNQSITSVFLIPGYSQNTVEDCCNICTVKILNL